MIKAFKLITNTIFIIIILLLIVYFALRVTDKVEIYVVKTGSMEEKIHVGDYILIYRKKDYKVGDVVTYTSNDGFITHRIIKKNGNSIITKGDANNTEDSEIDESTIVGKVITSGGFLNIIINYKYVIICLLLSLYLFSCYFNGTNNDISKNKFLNDIDEETKKDENLINLEVNNKKEIIENNEDTKIKDQTKKIVKKTNNKSRKKKTENTKNKNYKDSKKVKNKPKKNNNERMD